MLALFHKSGTTKYYKRVELLKISETLLDIHLPDPNCKPL